MIMDWLILLLLVPAILVPIVLLCGFAGCTSFGASPDTTVAAPSNLTAVATGTDGIKLGWQDNSGGTAKFNVERTATGETLQDKSSGFVDGGRNDGTDYFYQVKAIVAGVESKPSEAKATTKPNAPTNLVATSEDVNQIVLKWNHVTKSNKVPNIKFKITHTLKTPPGGITEISTSGTTLDGTAYTYPHPVAEGSGNEYQVTAVVDGFENSISKVIESDPSVPPASARPLAFKAVLTTDQSGLEGFCLIQKISKTLLKNSGTKVKITLHGPSVGNLTINKIYISQVAAAGDPYDSAADLTQVASAVSLLANTEKILPAVNYSLDRTKDLLIAFDISATAGQGNVRSVLLPGTGTEHYFRAATQQASVPDRSPSPVLPPPGFTTGPDRLYLIEKIEVL